VKITPSVAVNDLEKYVSSLGFRLSPSARKIFLRAEESAFERDSVPFPVHYLGSFLENNLQFQQLITERGGNLADALDAIMTEFPDSAWGPYVDTQKPYSKARKRDLHTRTSLVDLCLGIARKHLRREIFDTDILEALFEEHSEMYDSDGWIDTRLNLPYQTVMHIVGQYTPSLNLEFTEVLRRLNVSSSSKSPIETAPAAIRFPVLKLLQDYPAYNTNCFVIMSFASTRLHNAVFKSIQGILKQHGINALRADERDYADDLFMNIETYIYGCSFAVAVFERLEGETFNPNVSFEVGYMYGLGKPVCLLKERTMRQLHADIIGKLYIAFDIQNIEGTLPKGLEKWLKDNKII